MKQATNVADAPTDRAPDTVFSLLFFGTALLALTALLAYVLADGSAFNSFPGRTIGISLLSDIDPHYRISLFLLLSALFILVSCAIFSFSGYRPGWSADLPINPTSALLLATLAANLLALTLHKDRSLFLAGAAHCGFVLCLWLWSLRGGLAQDSEHFLLRLTLAWQGTTLLLWLVGLQPGLAYYPAVVALFLATGLLTADSYRRRSVIAVSACILLAPVALTLAVEWAYFSEGTAVTPVDTLLRFAGLSALILILAGVKSPGPTRLVQLGAICVLLSTFIINQYDNTVLYKGYDLFHLPEKMLPLHQWDLFRSLPFADYHPGHGVFDMLPHGAYHLFNSGNPLESMVWGNGYFVGWVPQTIYIGVLFALVARVFGTVPAFFLLWLLPVFHVLDPYNTLLLLPLFGLLSLPGSQHPWTRWMLQWVLTLALALWRADFGMIVLAGNLITACALSWHRQDWRTLIQSMVTMVMAGLALWLCAVLADPELIMERLVRSRDLMDIQLLAASYDHFYKQWDYLAWVQYIFMPLLAALAGGYALARIYRREDPAQLGIYLAVIFATAIGFAISIRLFQRHSLVEGFSKTNLFYLAPLLLLATLRYSRAWQAPLAAGLIIVTFLLTPKSVNDYREQSTWSPRRSYPVTTHPTSFPELAKAEPRLEDRVDKYDNFIEFTQHYLRPGEAFYDFANAPMLYMLANIKLPVYVYESVWHTSEKVQDSTLAELEQLRREKRLPFVVFSQNHKRWDALDGVDNALRSYKVAEYIYTYFRPCTRMDRFDIWTDKRRSCEGSLQRLLPAESPAAREATPLARDYLDQMIDFGHLPYIWANFDSHEDTLDSAVTLASKQLPSGVFDLSGAGKAHCRRSACYLDLTLSAPEAGVGEIRLAGKKLARFNLRVGKNRYRLRLSALYRWHQSIGGAKLRLASKAPLSVNEASLVQLAAGDEQSGKAQKLAVYLPD